MGGKAILAAGLVALLAGCGKDPMKNRVVKAETQQSVPKYFSIEYLPSGEAGKVKGFRLLFSPEQREALSKAAPVWYEVPEMKMRFPLPVHEPDFSAATTTFPNSEFIDGKTLVIYGLDRKLEEYKLQSKR